MSKQRYYSILKKLLLFGALFMLGESVYHFSGIRLRGTHAVWSEPAIVFSQFFMWLWASASLLIALVICYAYRYFLKAQALLIMLGLFSFFHAAILWNFSRLPLTDIWHETPAVFVWFSQYTVQLKFEALVLVLFGLLIGYGFYRGYISLKN